MSFNRDELRELIELLCEERITQAQVDRLDEIVCSDPAALAFYVEYQTLHTSLAWDTARTGNSDPVIVTADHPVLRSNTNDASQPASRTTSRRESRTRTIISAVVLCSCVLLAVAVRFRPANSKNPNTTFAENNSGNTPAQSPQDSAPESNPPDTLPPPIELESVPRTTEVAANEPDAAESTTQTNVAQATKSPGAPESAANSNLHPNDAPGSRNMAAVINQRIRTGWQEAELEPSPRASDAEWIRRIHLDLTGRLPDVAAVETFLADSSTDKYASTINRLLDETAFANFWASRWANLMVGRADSRSINRNGLENFLRSSFANNRGWNEIVADIITAEGSAEENGEAGFLLAHLNAQAVPATAITSRILLGTQIHCTQCHDHPDNDWTQDQFWSFNSIFKQIEAKRSNRDAPREIVSRENGGPTFYENRRGLMKAAFPEFDGNLIPPDNETNRREEFARILQVGSETQIARAFVNRVWKHFMGRAFTQPVDDMGPHNPPTHPELLTELSRGFVASGYDVKQLVRWICNSEPYRLSSRFGENNADDDPDRGMLPVFSRIYPRSLSAEQVYDSLLVATGADKSAGFDWNTARQQRDRWIQQFIFAHDTDENDESTSFDGTITQALMMMNGRLMDEALSGKRGTRLRDIATARNLKPSERIEQLCLAALSRKPTPAELTAFRKLLRAQNGDQPRALQDIFWAYLNSSEFTIAH